MLERNYFNVKALVMKTVLALLLSTLGISNAAAAFVTNGSMDRAGSSAGALNGFNQFVPTGWTATPHTYNPALTSTPDLFHNATIFNSFAWDTSPDGGTFVHGVGWGSINEGITQTITGLTIGQKYTVEFEQSVSYTTTPTAAQGNVGLWEVVFGSTTQNSAAMTTPAASTLFGWQTQSLEFTATAAAQALTFRAYSTTFDLSRVDLGLDGVSVNPVVVPIPGAVWVFGSGLVGLLGIARRRTASKEQ